MADIFEFPEDIKWMIFDYCFDPEYENTFDILTCLYLVELFEFDDRLIPSIMEGELDRFNSLTILTSDSRIYATKKTYSHIIVKDDGSYSSGLVEPKSLFPELLTLVKPGPPVKFMFADLIKNAQNISIEFPIDLIFLNNFKTLYSLDISVHENMKLKNNLTVNNLIFHDNVNEKEFKKIIKKITGIKNLHLASKNRVLKSPLSEVLPESVVKLGMYGKKSAFTGSGEPIYRDLKISQLICENIDFNFEPTGKNPVFPKNLTHLELGSIPSLMTKENRRILPNRKLKFLKIGINNKIRDLTFYKKGKKYSSLPDVETLILDLSKFQFLEDVDGIEIKKEIIIPESVVNLELIGIMDLCFEKMGIKFENPENLRSLVVTVCDKFLDTTDLDKISSIGKLESLVIRKHEDYTCDLNEKIVIKIPDSLRILISEIPVKLIGSFKNMIYIDIGE